MSEQGGLNVERTRAAERYRPERVRILLVAQMPPVVEAPDPPRYFYFENVTKHDHLFRAVARGVLGIEPDRSNKATWLARLCDEGVFLIDLKSDPLDPRPLTDFVPSLVERCRLLAPERIILIKADVYDAAFGALRAAGLPVSNVRIPFPSSGRQREFGEAFAAALSTEGEQPLDSGSAGGQRRPPQMIDPEHGLYLKAHGHGNERRFARLFREVWRQLPIQDRDSMLAHWANWSPADEHGMGHVSVSLENLSRLRHDRAVGDCAGMGMELKFYARVVDQLPDPLVRYVIAHELAHVLQVSRGQQLSPPTGHPLGDKVAYLTNPVEPEADSIARTWGFDGVGFDRWLAHYVRWDSLPPDPY